MAINALDGFSVLNSSEIFNRFQNEFTKFNVGTHDKLSAFETNTISRKSDFSLTVEDEFWVTHKTIRLRDCHNFTLTSELEKITVPQPRKYLIEVINCTNFQIRGISYEQGRNMIFALSSSNFSIEDCRYTNSIGSGVILSNCHCFKIAKNFFYDSLAAAMLLIGENHTGLIEECTVKGSHGFFNHDAAIHCCNTSRIMTSEDHPRNYHEPLSIHEKKQRTHYVTIRNCTLSRCRAQGIYMEGAANCYITNNTIIENNKEGICLDWGSSYNLIIDNTISLNGARNKLSNHEIETDFISEYPLLPDGSSSMKLPGISLDNGCLNLIINNKITSNYGGGIKMIRSALFNQIEDNQLIYNALGSNKYVPYYHGVTIMGLGEINDEFEDNKANLLDFAPSSNNTITNNTILERWRPFYIDRKSGDNHIKNNTTPKGQYRHNILKTTFYRLICFLNRKYDTPQRR